MKLLSLCLNQRKIVMLLGMFFILTLCSAIAGCTGAAGSTSTGALSSCDCRLRVQGALIYEGPSQVSCLSGKYVSEDDPTNSFTFRPDCKVIVTNKFGTKSYSYQTKAKRIWVSADFDAFPVPSDLMDLYFPEMPQITSIFGFGGESYRKV